jgi:3-dehydroquinate synthase
MTSETLHLQGDKKATKQEAPRTTGSDRVSIDVQLPNRGYKIWVSNRWLHEVGNLIRSVPSLGSHKEVMVFTSPTIGGLYYDTLRHALEQAGFTRIHRHDIPDGERHKNFHEYGKCLSALADTFRDPTMLPLVVNLGGGVVGDIGGFAAATFRRGVPYIQVPTTLLGVVDCGIGGKVDINFGGYKNLIGQFYQPKLVFADLSLLKTLEARQIRSGVAEVIKYGVVCSKDLFEFLEGAIEGLLDLNPEILMRVTTECYGIKAKVVEQDETDSKNIRIVLNFGHTIGHALETASDFAMTHGEAISVGMIAATRLAVHLGICAENVNKRVVSLIERAGLPRSATEYRLNPDDIISRVKHDKKFVNGTSLFVLPTSIGSWCKKEGIEENLIKEVALAGLV